MKLLTATTRELKICSASDHERCDIGETILDVSDCFLVLVCVEIGDNSHVVKEIANRVADLWSQMESKYSRIAVVPFGHLSEAPSKLPIHINSCVDKLCRVLDNKGLRVLTVSPNQADVLFANILLFDYGDSVRFSSSQDGLDSFMKEALSTFGHERVMHTLSKNLKTKGLSE